VLRIRDALGLASRRPWLGLFVVVLLALLLAFLVVQAIEDDAVAGAALTCLVSVLVVASAPAGRRATFRRRLPERRLRAPPRTSPAA
jgi:hypothetical protein